MLYFRIRVNVNPMLRRFHVYHAAWLLVFGVLAMAASGGTILCEWRPPKTSNVSHCGQKKIHSTSRSAHSLRDSFVTGSASQGVKQCSHCFTHLPWQANSSSNEVLPNNGSQSLVAADLFIVITEFSDSNSVVEIHDHGPPGNSSPRYLLNSAFRI